MNTQSSGKGAPPSFWRAVFHPVLDKLRTYLGMTAALALVNCTVLALIGGVLAWVWLGFSHVLLGLGAGAVLGLLITTGVIVFLHGD